MKHSNKFICPLPWLSVCIHTDGTQKVCCHSEVPHNIEYKDGTGASYTHKESMKDPINNEGLKKLRRLMLSGKAPLECKTCHEIEFKGIESPRNEALTIYEEPFDNLLKETNRDEHLQPRPLEFIDLSLGNSCNLECIMCHPFYSSGVERSWKKAGVLEDSQGLKEVKHFTSQKKDWPFIHMNFKEICLQGGEPLIVKDHLEVLQTIVAQGKAQEITLTYNTNLTVLSDEILNLWHSFLSVRLNISLDGLETLQEFIRRPLKWHKFLQNLEKIKNYNFIQVEFVTVVQALNLQELQRIIPFAELHSSTNSPPSFIFLNHPLYLKAEARSQGTIERSQEELDSILSSRPPHPELKKLENYIKNLRHSSKLAFDFQVFKKKLKLGIPKL